MSGSRSRFSGLVPASILDSAITIIGAGGLGSPAALCLAKMGFNNIILIDNDEVEEPNVGTQIYDKEDIGKPKVDAMSAKMGLVGSMPISWKGTWDTQPLQGEVLITAVDNMETRKRAYERLHRNFTHVIDPRMGAEELVVFTNLGVDYDKTLFTDEEAAQTACTERATVYLGFVAGGLIARIVKGLLLGEDIPRVSRIQLDTFNVAFDNRRTMEPTIETR